MTIGFEVRARTRAVDGATAAAFRALPVANVSDCMSRLRGAGPRLRPFHRGTATMAGPALTVRVRPGDNLLVHKALLMVEPGDVIVVDGGGDLTNALVGEMMLSYALAKGAAGIVLDAAVRDVGWIGAGDFPVFAAGVSHRGPYKDGPGEINVAVSLGGLIVEPGDLVLGDPDGVLCVPQDDAATVLEEARRKQAGEAKTLEATRAGRLDPKLWVDESLRRLGCRMPGEA